MSIPVKLSPTVYLYGGKVRISFDEVKHIYWVSRLVDEESQRYSEAQPALSVTRILKVIDKSGPLIYWATNLASEYIQSNITPGVPLDEIQIKKLANGARWAHRNISSEACDVGSLVHEWIRRYVQALAGDTDIPAPLVNTQARVACHVATDWITREHYCPMSTEKIVYSLKYDYVGTADAIGPLASVNGKSCIVDWKTSKAIYPEYRLQLAAYAQAYHEMTGHKIGDRWLIRIGKDGSFEAKKYGKDTFKQDLKAFLAAKTLCERLKQLEKEDGKEYE